MVGLLQDNLLEKDPGHDGIGMEGKGAGRCDAGR